MAPVRWWFFNDQHFWHTDAARGPSTPSFDNLVGAGEQEAANQMATFQPMLDLAGKFVAFGVRFQRPILNFTTVRELP